MDVEWAKLAVTLTVALVGTWWGIWKWSSERREDRRVESNRLATLYVNPFLYAAEDLQSRLYNILRGGGLGALRKRYQDGQYAEETLYLVACYFAYEPFVLRYTPYGIHPRIVRLIQEIRGDFATDRGGLDPWCIFRPGQRALGRLVLGPRQGERGTEVDTINLLDFKKCIEAPEIADFLSLKEALSDLKKAEKASDLVERTRTRLGAVQSHLVDLLEELEAKLGEQGKAKSLSLFSEGKRERVAEVTARRMIDLHQLEISLFEQLVSRRDFAEATMWQAPALSMAAQAFLLTIVFGSSQTQLARISSALLALAVAIASVQLMIRRHYQAIADDRELRELYGSSLKLLRSRIDETLHERIKMDDREAPWWIRNRPFRAGAYSWWLVTLLLFAFVDLIVLFLSFLEPDLLG